MSDQQEEDFFHLIDILKSTYDSGNTFDTIELFEKLRRHNYYQELGESKASLELVEIKVRRKFNEDDPIIFELLSKLCSREDPDITESNFISANVHMIMKIAFTKPVSNAMLMIEDLEKYLTKSAQEKERHIIDYLKAEIEELKGNFFEASNLYEKSYKNYKINDEEGGGCNIGYYLGLSKCFFEVGNISKLKYYIEEFDSNKFGCSDCNIYKEIPIIFLLRLENKKLNIALEKSENILTRLSIMQHPMKELLVEPLKVLMYNGRLNKAYIHWGKLKKNLHAKQEWSYRIEGDIQFCKAIKAFDGKLIDLDKANSLEMMSFPKDVRNAKEHLILAQELYKEGLNMARFEDNRLQTNYYSNKMNSRINLLNEVSNHLN